MTWVRGDAMFVALKLRPLEPGDWVIPTPGALKLVEHAVSPGTTKLVGNVCRIEKLSAHWLAPMWLARADPAGYGIWVTPETIEAWSPHDMPSPEQT